MTITPFGWANDSPPDLEAANLEAQHAAAGAYADTKVKPGANDVYALDATGTAATDIANLTAAIASTPSGGTVWLDGHYKINAALTISTPITIKGRQKVTYTGLSALPSGPNALTQVQGSIIEQTTAAVDALAVTIAGGAFHMQDVVVGFTSGLATTGHGINCAPTSNIVGVYGGSLERVLVFGHDGNHYGLVRTNSLEFTTVDYRWAGGGGILDVATAGTINYGNTVDIHPYGTLTAAGTAHGFAKSSAVGTTGCSGTGGSLNLMTFIRPQCNIAGAAGAAGTQKAWSDTVGAAYPWTVNVVNGDLEASGFTNVIDFGPGTTFVGDSYFSSQFDSLNTAYGYKALGTAGLNAGVQHKSVAVGNMALAALATNTAGTAVGYFALSAATGATNTAVGYTALMSVTTGHDNTAIGGLAGTKGGGTTGNAVVTGVNNVYIGSDAGPGSNADPSGQVVVGQNATAVGNYAMALGRGTSAGALGSVAIGTNHSGTATATAVQDQIALGTSTHHILLSTAAAPADASFAAAQFSFWLDPTNGACKLMIKAKETGGTVRTGSVALS